MLVTKLRVECKSLDHKEDAIILKYYYASIHSTNWHLLCASQHARSVVPKLFGLRTPSFLHS